MSLALRIGGSLAAFAVAGLLGIGLVFGFDAESSLGSWALVTIIAVPAAVVAYAIIEYAQTRRIDSIARQFDTRVVVLMPVAIAVNIILGTAVASALKIPVYLDSMGTILVAALGGPLAGAVTGLLSNTVWTYLAPPPFQSPFAAPFAIVAVVIGLLAGSFAHWGWLRPRRGTSDRQLAVGGLATIAVVVAMAVLAVGGWRAIADERIAALRADDPVTLVLAGSAVVVVAATIAGLLFLLVRRRDLAAAYVVVAGVITGIVSAFIAAPIAANLFGGVTGSGADFLVAAFRQGGADLQAAVLGQSLLSDSIDKVVSYLAVYLVLGALAVRLKARFPQGGRLIPLLPGHHPGQTTGPTVVSDEAER